MNLQWPVASEKKAAREAIRVSLGTGGLEPGTGASAEWLRWGAGAGVELGS